MRSKNKESILLILLLFLCALVKAQGESQDTTKKESYSNIAYGRQPSWAVSSSISTVSGEDLQKIYSPNLGNSLYGILPGLTVLQGGWEPGLQSPTLRVRGRSTFGTGTAVLVIVDGIESPFEQLVAEEIESITLLKDASATAIFGSKGANGVLLVKTRRGEEGKLKIGLGIQQGFNSPTHLPKFLGSYDYAALYNEALVNDNGAGSEQYSQSDLDAYRDGSDPYFHPDINWYEELLRKSVPSSSYDLSFSGGNRTVKFFTLLNLLSQQGLYEKTGDLSDNSINSRYQRFNFRSNVDFTMGKYTSMSLTLGGTVMNKENPAGNNTDAIFSNLSKIPPNSFPVYNENGTYGGSLLYSNPWGDLLETGFYTSNGRTFQTTLSITEKLDFLTPGLSASALVSFNSNFVSYSNKSREYQMLSASKDAAGNVTYTPIGQNTSLVGSEGETDQWRNTVLQGFINYNRSFGDLTMDGVLMFNGSSYTPSGPGVPYRDLGLFGRYTFTQNRKYIGEVSFGYNGSESFPEGGRWGFFPAVSLGWIVSNEGFLKDNNAITHLKVRGSYGLTGNDNIGSSRRYMWLEDYINMSNYFFGQTANTSIATIGEGQVADSNITWEKQRQLNIGLEATLFDHIDLSMDFFNQDRFDILAQPYLTIPVFLGVSNVGLGNIFPQTNVGEVNNKGFEAMIRYRSDETGDLQYYIQADIWYSVNKILYNAEALQLYDYLYRTGKPIGQPFVLESIGFFEDQADIDGSPVQNYVTELKPGDMKYKDQNGDNIIDQNDYYPVGNPSLPTLTGSLQAGLEYKGFDLNIIFQGAAGNTIMLSGPYYYAFQEYGKVSDMALGRWTNSTASTATYPRLSAKDNLNNFRNSSFWQRDGSYLKLRSIELGYSIPGNILGKIKLNTARIFLNGNNLFSLDHLDYTDAESLSGYPSVRTFSLGARIQF